MPVLKSMRLLNEILDGTIATSAQLTTKLEDQEALGQFHNIVNVTSLAQRMALVPEAMTIIASNEIAMGAIQNSKVNISNFLTLGVLYPRFGGYYAGSIELGTKSSHYFVRANMGAPSTDATLATRNMATWDDTAPQNEDESTIENAGPFPWYPIEYGKVDPLLTNNGDLKFDGAAITAAVATAAANTAATGTANTSDLAAILHCDAYSYNTGTIVGTLSDYFLPSIYELKMMDLNKAKFNKNCNVSTDQWITTYSDNVGGTTAYPSHYWSSTEYNSVYAWYVSFSSGNVDYGGKNNLFSVRATRKITI